VRLSSEQRTRVHTTIMRSGRVNKVNNVNISLNVGVRVPRDRVHLVTVPQEIVEIVPDYRGFLYFVVNDDIVIVDPDSLEIVAVIPA
jgi:hypothetical protein